MAHTKYNVFIWTDSVDLHQLRDACIQTTWDAGYAAYSHISPIATTRIDHIEGSISACDIFVCLCATRSGTVSTLYNIAVAQHKGVLVFVFNEEEPLMNPEQAQALIHWRRTSSDLNAFAREYLVALNRVIQAIEEPAQRPVQEARYLPSHLFNKLPDKITQSWVVQHRCHVNSILKQTIADYVADRYMPLLARARVSNLFFESGSSIAFLSRAFAARLEGGWFRHWTKFDIETNNILTYIDLLLAPSVETSLFPPGPPEFKYGATFGRLLSIESPDETWVKPPEPRLTPISERAQELVEEIRAHMADKYRSNGLLFAATSGIDLRHGPHVGSLANMLFKRALLEARCPTIIPLDEDKLDYPFDQHTCYYVCDGSFSWERVRYEVPLALACAFRSRESAAEWQDKLHQLGFSCIDSGSRHHTPWCVIATNDLFADTIRHWETACQPGREIEQGEPISELRGPDASLTLGLMSPEVRRRF